MKVAILGSGPAGMFAAHAVKQFTDDVVIYSLAVKSVLRGAQYLHKLIPGLTNDTHDRLVEYRKTGTAEGYANKVYGNAHQRVSWDLYEDGYHAAWDLRAAYDRAWDMYKDLIHERCIDYNDIGWLTLEYDRVITTIPLTQLQNPYRPTSFLYQDVWVDGWLAADRQEDAIYYNGTEDVPWYRFSNLWGWCAYEFADFFTKPANAVHIRKPISYAGEAVPPGWFAVGRYGAWEKTALTHDAYYKTWDRMCQV